MGENIKLYLKTTCEHDNERLDSIKNEDFLIQLFLDEAFSSLVFIKFAFWNNKMFIPKSL